MDTQQVVASNMMEQAEMQDRGPHRTRVDAVVAYTMEGEGDRHRWLLVMCVQAMKEWLRSLDSGIDADRLLSDNAVFVAGMGGWWWAC